MGWNLKPQIKLFLLVASAVTLVACAPENGPAPATYPLENSDQTATLEPALTSKVATQTPAAKPPVAAPPESTDTPHDLPPPKTSPATAAPATAEPERPTFTREVPKPQTSPATTAPKPKTQTATNTQPKTYEQELVMLINRSRAQGGLRPLHLNLYQSAGTSTCPGSYGHSVHMQQAGAISHDQFPTDICLRTSASAENVGMATGTKESAMRWIHQGMMDEGPGGGHYENIMSTKYDSVGVGLYYKNGTLWLTENFLYLGVDARPYSGGG